MDVERLTAGALRELVATGKSSAREVAEACLARAARLDPRLRAFLALDPAAVREAADAVDRSRKAGRVPGLLEGVPVALKDNLCVRGQRTTCGSRILAGYRPPFDAHVVERLRAEGAVLFGKTNLDEFAMGSSTENSAWFPTRNPWNTECIPGGSSGGSAAAVAARIVPLALGSDTGGSVRQPAAMCGVVGMKPTYGRVSRYGLIAFASSLDQIGPFGRNAADTALLLRAIAGPDPRDATCAPSPVPDYAAACRRDVIGLRIGVPREYLPNDLNPEIREAVERSLEGFRSLGARVEEVTLPHTAAAIPTYYLVATSEASSNLARYDGVRYGHRTQAPEDLAALYARTRREGFGAEVKRRIALGTFALSAGYYDAYYLKALKVRRLLRRDFDEALATVDVLAGPTSPIPPFRLGEKVQNPLDMYLCDVLTAALNLAGLPGVSVPCGFTKAGLPIGLQLIGRSFDEETLLRAAAALERTADHHTKAPPE